MEKQKVRISIDVEFLSSNVISGECLPISILLYSQRILKILYWMNYLFVFTSRQATRKLSVVEFWSNNQEILEKEFILRVNQFTTKCKL